MKKVNEVSNISSAKVRPNFRIVEGGSLIERSEIYEDFKADYISPNITVDEIKKKYGLTKNQYEHLRRRVAEETGINRKISKTKFFKKFTHYSRFIDYQASSGKYRVCKMIMGKKTHFRVYDDLDTAVYVRDTLEKNKWDSEVYRQLRYELFGEEEKRTKIERIYDDFKKDWMNGESVKFLLKKYHIGISTYKVMSKMVRIDTGIDRKPQLHYKVMRKHEKSLESR